MILNFYEYIWNNNTERFINCSFLLFFRVCFEIDIYCYGNIFIFRCWKVSYDGFWGIEVFFNSRLGRFCNGFCFYRNFFNKD